jgi:hypothetical protein
MTALAIGPHRKRLLKHGSWPLNKSFGGATSLQIGVRFRVGR